MAITKLFDLGAGGWITDGEQMLDKVMAWSYASHASQSYMFQDDITSIVKIVQDNAGNLERASSELEDKLKNYLSRFFDEVEIECSVVEKNLKGNNLLGEVILRASMRDHTGKLLELSEVMTNKGRVVRTVLDYDPFAY